MARATTIEMHVNGLVCAFCAQGIERKLRKFPATVDVVVSLEQRLVAVSLKEGQDVSDTELRKALTNAGYTVTTIERSDTSIDDIRSQRGAAEAVSTPTSALTRTVMLSAATLLSSAGTLVCCVLPAVLVALGAGAALAGLVTAIPQLVWLSEHKPLVFGIAFALLIVSGGSTWYSRTLPCPIEPIAARSCHRLRRINIALYAIAVASFAVGLTFAFILPRLM